VRHKRCGSSHLMSHKSGKRVRRLRKKATLDLAAESRRIRHAMLEKASLNPEAVNARRLASMAETADKPGIPDQAGSGGKPTPE
jgi:large subunit ribosomal protein L35